MSVINTNVIFNSESMNIFTDASITKINGETIGCSGAVLLSEPCNSERYRILRNTTNNIAEITSVLMGIDEVIKLDSYYKYKYINLFSDSKLSVYGLREWIFSWIQNVNNGIIYNSSNKPVKNQSLFLETIYRILNNNLQINIYHVRGHLSKNKKEDILKFGKTFQNLNFVKSSLSQDLILELMKYNDYVDNETRNRLKNLNLTDHPQLQRPMKYIYGDFDINTYKDLIGYKYN